MPSPSVELGREDFGTRLGVLLKWMLAKCRHTPPLSKAFENTVRWLCVLASVFPLSTFNKVGKRTALFW